MQFLGIDSTGTSDAIIALAVHDFKYVQDEATVCFNVGSIADCGLYFFLVVRLDSPQLLLSRVWFKNELHSFVIRIVKVPRLSID